MREERRQLPPIVYDVQDASRHQAKATLEAAQAAAAKSDLLQPEYMDLKLKVVTAQKALEQLEKAKAESACLMGVMRGSELTRRADSRRRHVLNVSTTHSKDRAAQSSGPRIISISSRYPRLYAEWDAAPKSRVCGGLVKADIVFFGESVAAKLGEDGSLLQDADLLIIMGTSLQVTEAL